MDLVPRKLTRHDRSNYDAVDKAMLKVKEKGILIDNNLLYEIKEEMEEENIQRLERLEELTWAGFNPRSPRDLREFFLEDLEEHDLIKYTKRTKAGGISFNKEVLEEIYNNEGLEEAELIVNIRSTQSLISKLEEFLRFQNCDGFIHPDWNYGETNRISFSNPGISNISERLRKVVVAPPGYKLAKLDYKQQEPYILVSWYNLTKLKELIAEVDDFYTALGIELLEKDTITDDERSKIKLAWLAISYGSSISTLYPKLGKEFAQLLYGRFKEKMSDLMEAKERIEDQVRENRLKGTPNLAVSFFGDVREVPFRGSYTARAMFNNPIQMTGSNILHFAIEDVENFKGKYGIDDDMMRIYWTVHDELILLVREDMVHLADYVKKLIEYQVEDWLPFRVELKISNSY